MITEKHAPPTNPFRAARQHLPAVARGVVLVAVGVGVLLLALLLATLPLPLAAGVVVAPLVLLLALIDPVTALYAAVLAVPLQETILLPGGISFVQASFLLALATWSLHLLTQPQHPIRLGLPFFGLAALLWALLLSATFTPYDRGVALTETLRWVTVLLIYLLAVNRLMPATADPQRVGWRFGGLAACLLLATAANGLFGVIQFFAGFGPLSFLVGSGFARAYGTIGQPNSFAGYMNMGWPLAAALAAGGIGYLWLRWWRRRTQPLSVPLLLPGLVALGGAGAALFFQFSALLLSLSRGGWVGAVGGALGLLLATLIVNWQNVRAYVGGVVWLVAGLAGGGAVLLTSGLLPSFFTDRVLSIFGSLRLFDARFATVTPENFAVVERMAQMQAAWYMILREPLTGVGPGNFPIAYLANKQDYLIHPWYFPQQHAHNYYLHIAAEAGIIGLAAYLLLVCLLLLQAWRTLRVVRGWFWQSLAIGSCGIIAAIAVHNLFENLHVLNMGVQLGAVWGMLVALEHRQCRLRHARIDDE